MTDSAPRHILVVDDDNRIRTLLSWQLEAEGFAVRCAADGAEALDRIGRDRPDLVILDLSLPGVGGLDVLRRVRQQEPAGATPLPVIILSGRSGRPTASAGSTSGPTTTWSSRSRPVSWPPGCGPYSAGPGRRRPRRAHRGPILGPA